MKRYRAWLALLALIIASCTIPMKSEEPPPPVAVETAPAPMPPPPPPDLAPKPGDRARNGETTYTYAVVKVFYATDRKKTESSKPAELFGKDRGTLTYGICQVSIPRDHRIGELETPSIWRLEFREDPEKHVVLLQVAPQDKNAFFADMASRVRTSTGKKLLLFVHGYNVTFADAARRTAQMSYDLAFDGAPVFYSWPSQGEVQDYLVDETNVEWTQGDLAGFLTDIAARTEAESIYLIAHSMGNRALTRAFATIAGERPELRKKFKEVILTAPDIDADVFKQDIAPRIAGAGNPVTLYASAADKALIASKKVHGYPRAGDAGAGLVLLPGIETIDATEVDTDFLGHSYYGESTAVISDLFFLIHQDKRPPQRGGLQEVVTPTGRYWKIAQ
ncbi:MAG TPA: alpha/beta hydrolase [Geomobilimonas sp.]|nr:alpha/beta hydrolase [Geomobilimonas sp.]